MLTETTTPAAVSISISTAPAASCSSSNGSSMQQDQREGDRDTRVVPTKITPAASATRMRTGLLWRIIHAKGTAACHTACPLTAADGIGLFDDAVNNC